MTRRFIAGACLAIAVAIAISAYKREKPNEAETKAAPGVQRVPSGHIDEEAHSELPRRVRLSADVIANAGIRTAPVGKEVLVSALSLPGEVVSDPDRTAKISSPVPGRIEQVSFREGNAVKK